MYEGYPFCRGEVKLLNRFYDTPAKALLEKEVRQFVAERGKRSGRVPTSVGKSGEVDKEYAILYLARFSLVR
jgi:hypothetical protein